MNCDHDFHNLHTEEVGQGGIHQWHFAILVCAFCGQVRHIYSDGRVKIVKEGEIKDERGS